MISGSAILGFYAAIKICNRDGYDPHGVFELVFNHTKEETMNASKEECRRAKEKLAKVLGQLDEIEDHSGFCQLVKDGVHDIRDFLDAAEKRLPSEKAIANDKKRNKKN